MAVRIGLSASSAYDKSTVTGTYGRVQQLCGPHLRLQSQQLAHQHSEQAEEHRAAVLVPSKALSGAAEDLEQCLHSVDYQACTSTT